MKRLLLFLGIMLLVSCSVTTSMNYPDGDMEYHKLHRKYKHHPTRKVNNSDLYTKTKTIK